MAERPGLGAGAMKPGLTRGIVIALPIALAMWAAIILVVILVLR
jgi:hypothetical protein